jgi:hypothetical protein
VTHLSRLSMVGLCALLGIACGAEDELGHHNLGSSSGPPTWIGVYGSLERHTGGNPGVFTVLMNRDYWGLHAEVGMQVDTGGWRLRGMSYAGNVDGNSRWELDGGSPFPPGARVTYYFHGWDGSGHHIWDSDNGKNYSFTVPPSAWSSPVLCWGGASNVGGLSQIGRGLLAFSVNEHRLSEDGGETWSPPAACAPPGYQIVADVEDGDAVHLLLRNGADHFTVSSNSAGPIAWSQPEQIPSVDSVGKIDLAADGGELYAVWQETKSPPQQPPTRRVVFSRKPAATGWQASSVIAPDAEYPSVAAASSGVHILYGTYGKANYARSTDGGASWIEKSSFGGGDYPARYAQMRADAQHVYVTYNVYAAPESSRIHFRRKPVGPSGWEPARFIFEHVGYKSSAEIHDLVVRGERIFTNVIPYGWYGGSGPAYVYESADAGTSWSGGIFHPGSGGPMVSTSAAITASGTGDRVYALVRDDQPAGNGLYLYSKEPDEKPRPALVWIGNGYHWPPDGQIGPTDDLWINIESYPVDAAASARTVYTADGKTWASVPMTIAGRQGNNDWWHVKLGVFASGTQVEYAIAVEDGDGKDHWFSDGGKNYHAYVE